MKFRTGRGARRIERQLWLGARDQSGRSDAQDRIVDVLGHHHVGAVHAAGLIVDDGQHVVAALVYHGRQGALPADDVPVRGIPDVGEIPVRRGARRIEGHLRVVAVHLLGRGDNGHRQHDVDRHRGKGVGHTSIARIDHGQLIEPGLVDRGDQAISAGYDIAVARTPGIAETRTGGRSRTVQGHGGVDAGNGLIGSGIGYRHIRIHADDRVGSRHATVRVVGHRQRVSTRFIDQRIQRGSAADDIAVRGRPQIGIIRPLARAEAEQRQFLHGAGDLQVGACIGHRRSGIFRHHHSQHAKALVLGVGQGKRIDPTAADRGRRRIGPVQDDPASRVPLVEKIRAGTGIGGVQLDLSGQASDQFSRQNVDDRRNVIGGYYNLIAGLATILPVSDHQRVGARQVDRGRQTKAAGYQSRSGPGIGHARACT